MEKPSYSVPNDARAVAREAIANHLRSVVGIEHHYYNIIGDNDDSLLHIFGTDAYVYHAAMLVAGLIDFRKVRNEQRYHLYVPENTWKNDFIPENKLGGIVQHTKQRVRVSVVDGDGNEAISEPEISFVLLGDRDIPPREWQPDDRYKRRMSPNDQLAHGILCPRVNLAAQVQEFLAAIRPVIAHGINALSYGLMKGMIDEGKLLPRKAMAGTASVEAAAQVGEKRAAEVVLDSDTDSADSEYEVVDSDSDDDDVLSGFEDEEEDESEAGTCITRSLLELGIKVDCTDKANLDIVKRIAGECFTAVASLSDINVSSPKLFPFTYMNGKQGTAVILNKVDYSEDVDAADTRFQRAAKDNKLVHTILTSIGGKDHNPHAAVSLIKALGKKHPDAFLQAAEDLKVPVATKMSPEYTSAIMKDANLNKTQLRMIKRKIEAVLPEGQKLFPTEREICELEEGFQEPNIGDSFYYDEKGKERELIEWWYKDVDISVEKYLKRLFLGMRCDGRQASDVIRVAIVFGGDHGQGAFRASVKILLYFANGVPPEEHEIDVAHVKCKKDNYDILKKSIMTPIGNSLKRMKKLSFKSLGQRGIVLVNADSTQAHGAKQTELFVTGDLLFYAVVLGRVAANFWCFCCDLHPTTWKEDPFELGEEWNMERMAGMADAYSKRSRRDADADFLGQRRKPEWDAVDISNWGCPRLHILIGLGNDIMSHFMDWVERDVINISAEEIESRNSLTVTLLSIMEKTTEKLNKENEDEDLKSQLNDTSLNDQEKTTKKSIRTLLRARIKELRKDIAQLCRIKKKLNTHLDTFHKNRKYDPSSTVSKINGILAKENIKREDYFEKKFNGVNIRKLMDHSDTIFTSIKPILKADNKGKLSDNDIDAMCNKYQALLDKVDAALKGLATPFPSPEQMTNTKTAIKQSVQLAKEMGLSITPKWHIFAVHCSPQHERLVKEGWGGLFLLDESFIEKSHQAGVALERQLRGLRMFRQKHVAGAKMAHRDANPEVARHLDKHREKKKRKSTKGDAERERKRLKRERAIEHDE